jgi:acetyl-CoA C-acetyltransferase
MTQAEIYILGGVQTDFSRKWSREGLGIYDLFHEALTRGLIACDLDPSEIETCHVGNFAGELFAQQGHLGGFFAHVDPALRGCPAVRHEAACASGSMAILAATAELEAGRYGLACVLGIEEMRNVHGMEAASHLGAAAWVGREVTETPLVWPTLFSQMMTDYQERYGLEHRHLMEIASKNYSNAKLNPNAQTRNWVLDDADFTLDDALNPIIAGALRKQDCSQLTDGAVALFLAHRERAQEYARRRGIELSSIPRIKGWGHRTTSLLYSAKFEETCPEGYLFPQVRGCFTDAYRRAGISGPSVLDGLETHDCFTITEYMALEHCGLTAPGEAWRAIESERTKLGGNFPVNASGGLIGLGHPVGATGVRMVLDAATQTRGEAGDAQIEGAKTMLTYNVGGSTTTSASFVIGV